MRQKLRKHNRDPERELRLRAHRVQMNPEDKTVEDVLVWMKSLGLLTCEDAFAKAQIDGDTLAEYATQEKFETLGLKAKSRETRKLWKAIRVVAQEEDSSDDEDDADSDDGFSGGGGRRGGGLEWPKDMDEHAVNTKIESILANRGKTTQDLKQQIKNFARLLEYCKKPNKQLEVLVQLISSQFDSMAMHRQSKSVDEMWRACVRRVQQLMGILHESMIVLPETAMERKDRATRLTKRIWVPLDPCACRPTSYHSCNAWKRD